MESIEKTGYKQSIGKKICDASMEPRAKGNNDRGSRKKARPAFEIPALLMIFLIERLTYYIYVRSEIVTASAPWSTAG